ncbi:hypothetical protein TVAG_476460 [Trichomonas vaginalis G3]|uniref:Uncharacterized protein n=1 Tax=Trichomonas vaginalis (strain ATCC PRA-98 / G3) TaxID=412133 RepID=A2DA69_TRIV3|nr:Flagellar C1a complex subunit C1a-32 family [Trichomonas vaginalis G3]EAY22717.1 hypothetical protein TVAG_476460 [Trichomonas vaginalis G3]KAI5525529.1 Flagellar C1a complex subunit C1a-32 family [Trichomonas vaginalis G3]|eukprot:XP_001583703.1 hypothetical protein [Trichomonas vaginalis G3]
MKHQDSRSSSSKKKLKTIPTKGRKGDDTEKQVVGAGWTTAATQKFIECADDDERMKHILAMFSINDDQYKNDIKSTTTADFHFANGLWCLESKFDLPQTQFICRTLDRLLTSAIQANNLSDPTAPKPNIDNLRIDLFNQFQTMFNELNQGEWKFTIEQTQKILSFYNQVFFRPLRLILYSYTHNREDVLVPQKRRIFTPIQPVPLANCVEEPYYVDDSITFKPFVLPKGNINLEDARELIQQYTENVIDIINKRYDNLEEMVGKVQQTVASGR